MVTMPHRALRALRQLLSDRSLAREALFARAKALGLFDVALRLTRDRLRILCYHAFSRRDEHRLDPYLFMRPEVFAGRLRVLEALEFPILGLAEALDRLWHGGLPNNATVLTFDDGFGSTLEQFGEHVQGRWPATLYVATAGLGRPVLNVSVRYLGMRSRAASVELGGLVPGLEGAYPNTDSALCEVLDIIRAHPLSPSEERALILEMARRLETDPAPVLDVGWMSLASPEALAESAANGLDLQLHSHTHRFPADPGRVAAEIGQNRQILEPLAGRRLTHFCYPSGHWSAAHWASLEAAGVESATTCLSGLNAANTPRLALFRFVDGDHLSDLTFEAELTGFTELLRQARRGVLEARGAESDTRRRGGQLGG